MNLMDLFLTAFLTLTSAFASEADQMADYVVPTGPELVEHSRFKVGIVQSYAGTSSNEISYVFPPELTGEPALFVKFTLVEMDQAKRVSRWDSKEMSAVCTDDGEKVQCNIYVKKEPMARQNTFAQLFEEQITPFSGRATALKRKPLMDSTKAVDFIKNSGLPKDVINDKLQVLDKFLSSEPGGILTYEYK